MPLIYRRRHSWFYHSKSIMPYFEIIPTDVQIISVVSGNLTDVEIISNWLEMLIPNFH